MTPEFDMKQVTTPLLLHMLGKELRFPRVFLLLCRFTLGRFKKTIDQRKAFEIVRVALLTGGTAAQNLQFDTVHKERNFRNFTDMEIKNNRTGLVRWNKMELVERTDRRFELKITRCMFHKLAVSWGLPELTPICRKK